MAYEAFSLRRQKLEYNSSDTANTLTAQLKVQGQKITPDSATICAYAPGTTVDIIGAATMTVTGTIMSYAVDTTDTSTWPLGTGYRADIEVAWGTDTAPLELVFDVVSYLLRLNIGRDQLVARDASIVGMDWAGDETFAGLIEACTDQIQLMLETHAIDQGQLVENMILDNSRIAIPAVELMLSQLFFSKKDKDNGKRYEDSFKSLFKAMLGGIKFDVSQSGSEEGRQGRIQTLRWLT